MSNITNSLGAAHQTVVDDHNQQTIQQQNSELIKIVDQILASDEFKSLSEANRDAVQDTAEALRGEIAKQVPDQSRIRRWAERLLAFAKEFGMHMAATALTKLLMAWPALNAIAQHPSGVTRAALAGHSLRVGSEYLRSGWRACSVRLDFLRRFCRPFWPNAGLTRNDSASCSLRQPRCGSYAVRSRAVWLRMSRAVS